MQYKGRVMAKSMYDIIKNQNGERFAKAIRNYDNGIFDIPDIDKIVKYAGRDAEPIMNYLVSLKQIKIQEMSVHMDPITLLDRAGYDAYIADTLEKQNAIRKYYARGEELCTFRDDDRFKKYYIINAVRKDVDKIKRGNPPQRDDEYGTSVISIQVLKTGGFISIKNRYNHTVQNCDNTLNSNPDNIILGLSDAIKHHFNVDFSAQRVALPGGYTLVGNQICKYYHERNNVYVSEDFYIKDGRIYEIDKSTQIALGNGLVFDLKHKPNMIRFRDVTGSTRVFDINYLINDRAIRIEKNTDGSKALYAGDEHILSYQDGKMCYINPKNLGYFVLQYANLKGDLDFSNIGSNLSLEHCDLSQATSLKLPIDNCFEVMGMKYYTNINLEGAILPPIELDFSNSQASLTLSGADMSRVTKLVLPRSESGTIINLDGTIMPACDLDLSHLTSVHLKNADLSRVTKLTLPKNAKYFDLSNTELPACELDLSNVNNNSIEDMFDINGANLSRVTKLKLPKNLQDPELNNVIFPVCDLDFSSISYRLSIQRSDMSRVSSLILPKTVEYIYANETIFPAITLDFSNIEGIIELEDADLSRVKKLILPKDLSKVNLEGAKLPKSFILQSADKQLRSKIKTVKGRTNVQNTNDTNER